MKKLTSAVLVGVLCTGVLTACGSKQSTDTTNTSVSTTESQSSGQSSNAIVKIVSLNVNNNLDKQSEQRDKVHKAIEDATGVDLIHNTSHRLQYVLLHHHR